MNINIKWLLIVYFVVSLCNDFCCKSQKIYSTSIMLQKVECSDSNLMRQIEKVAFSDSIDSIITKYIYPDMTKFKKKVCTIAIRSRGIIIDSGINNSYYPTEKNYLLNDSNTIQIQLMYGENLKYYIPCGKNDIVVDSDYGNLFNRFFHPVKGVKRFTSKSRQVPVNCITNINDVKLVYDFNPIYVFIYDGKQLYLDPQIDIWDWANEFF